MAWKVTFDGFDTQEQAQAFADWYGGQGEQDAAPWLEEHSDIDFAESVGEKVYKEAQVIAVQLVLNYQVKDDEDGGDD